MALVRKKASKFFWQCDGIKNNFFLLALQKPDNLQRESAIVLPKKCKNMTVDEQNP